MLKAGTRIEMRATRAGGVMTATAGVEVLARRWKDDSSDVRLERHGDVFWVRWVNFSGEPCGHGWKTEAEARADFATFMPPSPYARFTP